MKLRHALIAAAAVAIAIPASVQAHRQWMLPSMTVVSGEGADVWVTFDAAVSNDLFYFEHQPMRADVSVLLPDGNPGEVKNKAIGRYRQTFDLQIGQRGTYKIFYTTDGVTGSYKLNGEEKRLPRGTTTATLAQAIPAGATDIKTSETSNRNEVFVTAGEPTTTVFKPTGKGIELVPVTHPNDLVMGEDATFQFLLDGKPATGLAVTVIPGGIRYRDQLKQQDLKTGADGKVTIKWSDPGMTWINVTTPRPAGEEGQGPAQRSAPGGRRASYVTTVEVMAP
ncbi:DUF4198 domain-containing protein [Sphingomonas turrisvirgatae]|uniref:ABC transporter permease n=1 Tax=Sphingomonas turrisvirgatae TaxID=1888892 RepID=A0A1E3LZ08_9SPHN|nr:DUF4198 domain-containing protein [Sphingomonas turrisvirgatae]ODP39016.1 ABC transporter permease [Sphingomonas turrisvirgatae]